ncbi:MAG: GTP pyrophosphokinase family protein [Mogibacterium sp.]|nr:GTP pyrophosphokinase family protein [Mogibacterium sp.]MBR2540588.1 GTP pyrophosphokinase family protein [Mogibacterium sp.]
MSYKYFHADRLRERVPQFRGTDEELQEAIDDLNLLYLSAIREVDIKLQILSDDFDMKHSYMPIHHIQSRLKSVESIMEKATRYGIEDPINNLDVVRREILDIAGVRVVCNYEEDLHTMSGLLLAQEDIELIRVKDYCNNPKESGYRSLHVVVAVPVYLVNRKKMVPVEIQFRSIAMDAWASLEHELRYKNKGELSQDIVDTLKESAELLHTVDERLSKIRHKVLNDENKYSNY